MPQSEFALLRSRRFLPLFVTQFLGAMNDNVFKNAFVILVLYGMADFGGSDAQVLVTVAAGESWVCWRWPASNRLPSMPTTCFWLNRWVKQSL